MNRTRTPSRSRRARRAGATLTEVLMALLVMGIGLVSVATLFPLSLLRSVEATKLTNATLTRMNAEARLKASVWQDGFGNPIQRAIIEDPDRNGNVSEHERPPRWKFFYDPLGRAIQSSDNPLLTTNVGWVDINGDGLLTGADSLAGMERNWFGLETLPAAQQLKAAEAAVTLPDSFVGVADVLGGAVAVSGTTVTINGPDISEFAGQFVRVTFLHADGRSSAVRDDNIAKVTGANTIDIGAALPASFAGNISRVTVEWRERRYTWLATVRRVGVKPSVTVVVFFRRSFAPEDERIFFCEEPPGGYNEFELNLDLIDAGQKINNKLTGGATRPPGLHVGGYMFDVNTFRWLKIASLEEFKRGGSSWIRFTTDPEDVDPSVRGRLYNSDPKKSRAFPVMFPRNVVEAYTLKKD